MITIQLITPYQCIICGIFRNLTRWQSAAISQTLSQLIAAVIKQLSNRYDDSAKKTIAKQIQPQ